MSSFLTDLEIANQANKKHINHIAKQIDVPEEALIVYGNDKAKINYDFLDKCKDKKDGKLKNKTEEDLKPCQPVIASL